MGDPASALADLEMGDPASALTALGLVANVFQVIEFSARLVPETRDFLASASGTLPRYEWLERLAQTHQGIRGEIQETVRPSPQLSKVDQAVYKLEQRCIDEAGRLIKLMEPFKLAAKSNGKPSKLEAAYKSLKSKLLKDGQIEASQDRLERLEIQLCALLLHSVRQSQLEEFTDVKAMILDQSVRACDLVTKGNKGIVDNITNTQERLSKDLKNIRDTVNRLEAFALGAEGRAKVERVRRALSFSAMNDRALAIEEREVGTFDWIFEVGVTCRDCEETASNQSNGSSQEVGSDNAETPCQHAGRSSFSSFMTSTENVFWICGEPGSGKSMLMKSMCHHDRTLELTQQWSRGKPFLIADYYFWIASSDPLQKSSAGMLRTLLHQAVTKFPGLLHDDRLCSSLLAGDKIWQKQALLEIFARVAEQIKMCLLIDGLDECDGDQKKHAELVQDLEILAKRANIKICLSSRPWMAFERAYSTVHYRLLLQDLTKLDIFNFVSGVLARADPNTFTGYLLEDSQMLMSHHYEPANKQELATYTDGERSVRHLVHRLVSGADGSFLWTSLKLQTLCARIEAGASPPELHRHLGSLPVQLEDYYAKSIYERISETYRSSSGLSETAIALKLAVDRRVRVLPYWWLKQNISNYCFATNPPDFGGNAEFTVWTSEEAFKVAMGTKRYLDGCCRGLLEMNMNVVPTVPTVLGANYLALKPTFKHRTIFDFLKSARGERLLSAQTSSNLDEGVLLDELSLFAVKQMVPNTYSNTDLVSRLVLHALEINVSLPHRLALWKSCAIDFFGSHCPRDELAMVWEYRSMDYYHIGFSEVLYTILARAPEVAVAPWWPGKTALGLLTVITILTQDMRSIGAVPQTSLALLMLENGADPNHAAQLIFHSPVLRFTTNPEYNEIEAPHDNNTTQNLAKTHLPGQSGRSVWHEYLWRSYLGRTVGNTESQTHKPMVESVLEAISLLVRFGADLQNPVCVSPEYCPHFNYSFPDLRNKSIGQHRHEWMPVKVVFEAILGCAQFAKLLPIVEECDRNAASIRQRRLAQIANCKTKDLLLVDVFALGRGPKEWKVAKDVCGILDVVPEGKRENMEAALHRMYSVYTGGEETL